MRNILTASALALAAVIAAPAGAAEPTFSDTTSVVAVEIPVQVSVDGEPVRNLTADNFEVTDSRKKQEIVGFSVVDLALAPAATTPAAAAEAVALRRHFLLLFDLSFSDPTAIVKARAAARDLVATQLHPTDLVGVATYSMSGSQLVLGFTSDRRQIGIAIDTLGRTQLFERAADPLSLMIADDLAARGTGAPVETKSPGAEVMLENLRDLAALAGKSERENQSARVMALTRSFTDLARTMNAVRGRKYVVYLSQGFDSRLLTGNSGSGDDSETRIAAEAGEVEKIDTNEMFGSTRVQNELEQMMEEFRRADCVIQSVDIGGLSAAGDQGNTRAPGKDGLFVMAKDTGGEFFQNFNNLGEAMSNMLRRTSVTYVLTIQPADLRSDGKYRKLNVKLKNAPKGARVTHRPGYYAPKPFRERGPFERQLQAAEMVVGGGAGSGSVAARVLAAPFQQAGELAYVPVVIEIPGAELLTGHQGDGLPIEIYAYALDSEGNIRGHVAQSLGLDLKKVAATLRTTGIKFFGHLDLAPGDYALRVLIRNSQTGVYGLQALSLTVPAKTATVPYLLPPLFPEAAGRWIMLRENLKAGQTPPAYPFMVRQDPYIPAVRAEVRTGAEAPVSLVGYGFGAGALQVVTEVFGADGTRVDAGKLRVIERLPAEATGTERLLAGFDPSGLALGEYTLKVSLIGSGGRADAVAVPITVVAGAAAGSR